MMSRQLSLRERLLLLVAGLVVASVGYFFVRYRPLAREIDNLNAQRAQKEQAIEKLRKDVGKAAASPLLLVDESNLRSELSALKQQQQQAARYYQRLRNRMLPPDDVQALQALKVDLADLAKQTRVRIVQSGPLEQPEKFLKTDDASQTGASGPFLCRKQLQEECGSQLQEMVLESSFHNLRRFLARLRDLPQQVVVVHFEFDVDKKNPEQLPQPVRTRLILAM